MQTLNELLKSWDVNGANVVEVVKLARVLSRESVRYARSSKPRAWKIARECRRDASDLLTYAREVRNQPSR